MKRVIAVGILALLLGSGCARHDNNYLKPADFARKLQQDGLKIETVNVLDPAPLGASEALELRIAGSGIGVYKYDRASKAMCRRLERIEKSKRVYFNGIPYPIYEVCGSFVVVGLDKNIEKHRILESLRNFR